MSFLSSGKRNHNLNIVCWKHPDLSSDFSFEPVLIELLLQPEKSFIDEDFLFRQSSFSAVQLSIMFLRKIDFHIKTFSRMSELLKSHLVCHLFKELLDPPDGVALSEGQLAISLGLEVIERLAERNPGHGRGHAARRPGWRT